MSQLLTRDEYLGIAAGLDMPRTPFINGGFKAGTGTPLAAVNPATGEQLVEVSTASVADVDRAVGHAREAFGQGHWRAMHPAERKDVLLRLCRLMYRQRRDLAVLESLDSGKPIRDCELIDVPEAINTIRWHAESLDKLYDQTAPAGDDALAVIVREPVGVVAAVLPWNFPLLMLAWKLGPALGAGNSVIIKPAEQTSLTALRVAEMAAEAGLPRGVLQVLPGDGAVTGAALGKHDDVDMVSFTGSTETGRAFLRYSADSNLKRVVLECGGKNPAVVLHDAEHLDRVAAQVVNAAFWNMGENCSANSRLIVHESLKAELVDRVIARLRDWKTGDPLDPGNYLGALIDAGHAAKVASFLDGSGTTLSGGEVRGNFLEPTVIDGIRPGDRLATEEAFGPVLAVITAGSDDEALQIANDTQYGLTASVFSASGRRALRAARELRAGTVTINCYGEGDITTPFGGYKQSGFGGRDNGVQAHDQFTEVKTIWMDLTDPQDDESLS